MEKIKCDVLKLLTENSRYSNDQIAKMLNVQINQVAAAIKELEDDGVIIKYSAIVNNEALKDEQVEALIEVKVAPQKLMGFDSYAEVLYHFPEVRSLYLMSGGFDLAIFVNGANIGEIAKFVSAKLSVIEGITGVQTHFVLKKYKVEGQVTGKDLKREREILHA